MNDVISLWFESVELHARTMVFRFLTRICFLLRGFLLLSTWNRVEKSEEILLFWQIIGLMPKQIEIEHQQ